MAGFTNKRKSRGRRGAKASVSSVFDAKLIGQFKKARIKKGFTQGDLAKIVGTKQSAISRFESGRYNPSVEFLVKVASALGKKVQIRLK